MTLGKEPAKKTPTPRREQDAGAASKTSPEKKRALGGAQGFEAQEAALAPRDGAHGPETTKTDPKAAADAHPKFAALFERLESCIQFGEGKITINARAASSVSASILALAKQVGPNRDEYWGEVEEIGRLSRALFQDKGARAAWKNLVDAERALL